MPSVLASAAVGLPVAEVLECASDTTNAKDCESAKLQCDRTSCPGQTWVGDGSPVPTSVANRRWCQQEWPVGSNRIGPSPDKAQGADPQQFQLPRHGTGACMVG